MCLVIEKAQLLVLGVLDESILTTLTPTPPPNRCLSGFSGKNCEEIIDYCRLLNINCLNEGLCLSVIGGYQVGNSMFQSE